MPRLSDDDIQRLDDYLEAHCASAGGLVDSEALDGYLSAVVVAPMLIMPSDWMRTVWGHDHRFADEATAKDMIERLMRAYNGVVERIRDPASAGEPTDDVLPLVALPEPDPDDPDGMPDLDDTSLPVGALWSWGFQLGRSLRAAAWDERSADWEGLDEDLQDIDDLLLGLDGEDGSGEPGDAPPTLGERLSVIASIPALLHDLYLDAQQRSLRAAAPVRRESPKVGRNDPCPCGSGRKYKHCHGAH